MNFLSKATPFAIRNLHVANYAGGWTMWVYRHAGSRADCCATKFWRDAADMLSVGDVIAVSANDGAQFLAVRKLCERGAIVSVI